MIIMSKRQSSFLPNVQTYGQLLPVDALQRILNRDKDMEGLADADYHLVGERQNEAINRSWQKMLSIWRNFASIRQNLSDSETGTAQTRENLLLPLFMELGYGRLSPAKAEERQVRALNGAISSYPISHFRDESPIHLVGCNVPLDKKSAGVTGAAKQSPHSLVQEFLNRSDAHLWGFVSNGLVLRILRDNASLSQQAYVEFNLQGIFEGESFSEFALLWLAAHHSRVHTDNEPPEKCWLERWSRDAKNAAVTALDKLRDNVTGAIQILGQGFITANPALRQKLASGELDRQNYFRQLLRLAYRLIFLLVVEERNLLHAPDAPLEAREIYERYWSLSRLRDMSAEIHGTKHHDLWEGIKFVMQSLGSSAGFPELGLAPMGGFLWSDTAMPDIISLRLTNGDLLSAMRKLAFTDLGWERRPVDWRHLGAMELGSIYESLLELHPEISEGKFELRAAAGNERKTTGSYYTPTPLIENLLETALDPVIAQALKTDNPETAEAALLNLKICDPACGSGHFLLAAANRLAKRLAQLRSGDSEPSVDACRHALREVVSRCVYGMDINPMSVELCKVGLWLETHEAGKPLSFLDHHIVCANSLMGTTAQAIKDGIPASAYAALGGDDKKAVAALKKANVKQCKDMDKNSLTLFGNEAQAVINAVRILQLDDMPSDTIEQMERRELAWREWQKTPEWEHKKFLYDLWTAVFVLECHFPLDRILPSGEKLFSVEPFGITWNTLLKYVQGKPLPDDLVAAVKKAANDYQFFHYEVMFPEVAVKGGFDVILGNPPWERIKLQEKEWFTDNNYPDIAEAPNAAARRKKIAALEKSDPLIFQKWLADLRKAEALSHYLRNSGIYPLCGQGDINLYTVFAEWMRNGLNKNGRVGSIVPSGIATDDTTKFFFQDMVETQSLVSLYDFENKGIFPSVHSSYKFSLLTTGSGAKPIAKSAKFVFFAHSTDELKDADKLFKLSPAEITLLNPNTRTCPIFRSKKDAELTKAVYRRVPVLIRIDGEGKVVENPWGIKFGTMFHMSNDSHLFRTKKQLDEDGWELNGNVFEKGGKTMLPLYEAKMIHHFNHRWGTYQTGKKGEPETRDVTLEELEDPEFEVLPRYWVGKGHVDEQLERMEWGHDWLMGWRNICRSTDERTVISGIIQTTAVGHSCPLSFINEDKIYDFYGMITSFVTDYFARQKIGGTNLTFGYIYQFPVLPPNIFDQPTHWQHSLSLAEWLKPHILELTYTAEDMRPFAEDLGYDGDPFIWDEERRAAIRAELDAAFFHLYLPANPDGTWQKCDQESQQEYESLVAAFPTPRNAVEYVMETFPITRDKDIKKYGEYRTKTMILQNYDGMLEAISAGGEWQSPYVKQSFNT